MNLLRGVAMVVSCGVVAACSGSNSIPDGGTSRSDDLVLTYVDRDAGPFVVDQDAGTIRAIAIVDGKVDVQHFYVIPDITLSPGATIVPASGVTEDLHNEVKYTVTAEDGVTTRLYRAELIEYQFDGKNPASQGKLTGSDPTPRPPGVSFVPDIHAAIMGTWTFAHSGALEAKTVGADTVLTLLEQTPTTQTVTVMVNDMLQAPMTTSGGHYGWTATFKLGGEYSGSDDQGDTSTGTWTFVDLGSAAINRYAIDVNETTVISGGPTATGTVRWYVTGIYAHALFLTRDPMMTSKSTTTYDITLVR